MYSLGIDHEDLEDLRPDQRLGGWARFKDRLNFEEWLHSKRVWYGKTPLQVQRVEGERVHTSRKKQQNILLQPIAEVAQLDSE